MYMCMYINNKNEEEPSLKRRSALYHALGRKQI